nr:hypothetical protein Iba_scaffold26226CG0010 [Ipomoea batatas]
MRWHIHCQSICKRRNANNPFLKQERINLFQVVIGRSPSLDMNVWDIADVVPIYCHQFCRQFFDHFDIVFKGGNEMVFIINISKLTRVPPNIVKFKMRDDQCCVQ